MSEQVTLSGLPGVREVFRQAWQNSRGSISLLTVWVCLITFVAVGILNISGIASRQHTVLFLGLSWAGLVEHHWWHQLITAPLLHLGTGHLLFNMLSLWFLGPGLERTLGRGHYVTMSCVCALCAMAGFLICDRGHGSVGAGYSGVIFGLLVGQAMFFPDTAILMYFFPVKMRYAVWILGITELYLTVAAEGGDIAHAAHLFGAAAALVYLKTLYWREGLERLVVNRQMGTLRRRAKQRVRTEIPEEL